MGVRVRLPPDAGAPPAALAVEAGGTEPAEPVPRTTATRTTQLTRVTIPSTTAPSTLPMGPHLRSGGGGQNEPRAQRTTSRSGDPSAREGRNGAGRRASIKSTTGPARTQPPGGPRSVCSFIRGSGRGQGRIDSAQHHAGRTIVGERHSAPRTEHLRGQPGDHGHRVRRRVHRGDIHRGGGTVGAPGQGTRTPWGGGQRPGGDLSVEQPVPSGGLPGHPGHGGGAPHPPPPPVPRAAGLRHQPCRGPGHHRRRLDRKSTRLNSSHLGISYALFCLKKKKKINTAAGPRDVLSRRPFFVAFVTSD